jgi:glycosyltransferase involved in cell wall biosynthesis
MRPLRIGVNALYLIPGGVGGTEIYLRNLLRALVRHDDRNQYFVFTNVETGRDLIIESESMHLRPQDVRASNRLLRLVWEQTELPMEAQALGLDCMLNPGFTAPIVTACPNVTVFHDLQHKRHPEYFRWFDLPAWQFFLWASARRSCVLIADSEPTKADLMHYYSISGQRIRVVPLGVEEEFFRIADQRTTLEPILLCASTLHPHKNLERLVRAFTQFRQRRPEFKLVITGVRGFHTEALEQLVSNVDAIELTGWITRNALYDLFRRAYAFLYPSTFEGFGLPVVEAMAAGIPLGCSDIEPLRTITGDAAIRFNLEDTDAIACAMEHLVSDTALRDRLTEAGRKRARQFTWEACGRGTLDAIYAAIAANPRAGS